MRILISFLFFQVAFFSYAAELWLSPQFQFERYEKESKRQQAELAAFIKRWKERHHEKLDLKNPDPETLLVYDLKNNLAAVMFRRIENHIAVDHTYSFLNDVSLKDENVITVPAVFERIFALKEWKYKFDDLSSDYEHLLLNLNGYLKEKNVDLHRIASLKGVAARAIEEVSSLRESLAQDLKEIKVRCYMVEAENRKCLQYLAAVEGAHLEPKKQAERWAMFEKVYHSLKKAVDEEGALVMQVCLPLKTDLQLKMEERYDWAMGLTAGGGLATAGLALLYKAAQSYWGKWKKRGLSVAEIIKKQKTVQKLGDSSQEEPQYPRETSRHYLNSGGLKEQASSVPSPPNVRQQIDPQPDQEAAMLRRVDNALHDFNRARRNGTLMPDHKKNLENLLNELREKADVFDEREVGVWKRSIQGALNSNLNSKKKR